MREHSATCARDMMRRNKQYADSQGSGGTDSGGTNPSKELVRRAPITVNSVSTCPSRCVSPSPTFHKLI